MALNLVTGYAGEEHVTAIQDALLNRAAFDESTYVTDYGDKFAGAIITNNEITIGSGCMIIQGREVVQEGTQSINIESGTIGQKRIDLVCAHYDKNPDTGVESFSWEVLTGIESQSPEEPTVVTGNLFDATTLTHYEPMFRVDVDKTGTISLTKLFEEDRTLLKEITDLNANLSELETNLSNLIKEESEIEIKIGNNKYRQYIVSKGNTRIINNWNVVKTISDAKNIRINVGLSWVYDTANKIIYPVDMSLTGCAIRVDITTNNIRAYHNSANVNGWDIVICIEYEK